MSCVSGLSSFSSAADTSAVGGHPRYDLLIKGATVVDGTGASPFSADVLVKGDAIVFIGRMPADRSSVVRIIEAQGRVLAPGFIDTHSHGDPLQQSFASYLAMGVTTVVLGQDGESLEIGSDESAERRPGGLLAWMKMADRVGVDINVAPISGHGTIRHLAGVPDGTRPLSFRQQSAMNKLLDNDLRAGSFGLTTGLEYVPGIYAAPAELAQLAHVVEAHDGVVMSHMRSEDDDRIEGAIDELVAQDPHARLHISHLKVVYGKGAERGRKLLAFVQAKCDAGIRLSADAYPYTAGYTSVGILFPQWALPPADYRSVVSTRRAELAEYLELRMLKRGGPEALLFGSEPYIGQTLAQAARAADKSFADVLIDMGPRGGDAAHFIMDEALQDVLFTSPTVAVSTDGAPGVRHPRATGTYAKLIEHYVEEMGALNLQQAIYKATGLPASILGIDDRGVIKVGAKADLILFDPKKVHATSDYVHPLRWAEGFDVVVLNGHLSFEGGAASAKRFGRVLRHFPTSVVRVPEKSCAQPTTGGLH